MPALEKSISAYLLRRIRAKRAGNTSETAPRRPAGPVRLREADFSDCSAVGALKSRHRLSPDSLGNWHRLWRQNPAAEGNRGPIGWLLESEEGIVGYLGNIPLHCHYRGTLLQVVSTHALVSDPAYRAYTAGLVRAWCRQKGPDLLIATSAERSSGEMFRAFGGQPLPQADYDTVLFWVLDPHRFLFELQRRLDVGGSALRVASRLAAWGLCAERTLRRRRPGNRAQTCKLMELRPSEIDHDFDDLWRRKVATTDRLIANRSAATLRWHFNVPGDRRDPVVFRCDIDGRLAGYVVVLTNTTGNGLKKAVVADLLVEDENSSAAQDLLIAAYDYARRTQHHLLELLGFPGVIRRICSTWNPYTRKYPSYPYFFRAAAADLQRSLGSEDAWYGTPYDGDATLIPDLNNEAAPDFNRRHLT